MHFVDRLHTVCPTNDQNLFNIDLHLVFMAHNIVVLKGVKMCNQCGLTSSWYNNQCVVPPHNIVDSDGVLMCTKCGLTSSWYNNKCHP